MRPLYQARDRIEAQFLRDFLDRHLIATTVLGDYLAGAAGELPVNIFPTVWVIQDEDLPRAQALLKQFLNNAPPCAGPDWVCPQCGERVEGDFELCWNCSHPRE
jgi:hypothetical protein